MSKKSFFLIMALFASSCVFAGEGPAAGPADAHMCSICLQEGNIEGVDGYFVQTPCGHVFHRHCITAWLLNHDTCPICRQENLTVNKLTPVDRGRPQAPAVHDDALLREIARVRAELQVERNRRADAEAQAHADRVVSIRTVGVANAVAADLVRVDAQLRDARTALRNLERDVHSDLLFLERACAPRYPCLISFVGGMFGGILAGIAAGNIMEHAAPAPLVPAFIGSVASASLYEKYYEAERSCGLILPQRQAQFIYTHTLLPDLVRKRQYVSFSAGFVFGSLASFFVNILSILGNK